MNKIKRHTFTTNKGWEELTNVRCSMKATTCEEAQIEIDHERGVIYVHSTETGRTILRISQLPKIPKTDELLDIAHLRGCSWGR